MTSTPEPPLPPSIELAWGLRDAPRRGPKRGLTLDLIVSAGIKVAHTDGLGALSMSRVAGELGVATMALYRYVSAKDELLTLMCDKALGTPDGVVQADSSWRDGLGRWAHGIRNAYRRNLWAIRVPISGPPLTPNNVAWLEAALECLAETPLTEQEKASAVLLVSGFVRNEVQLTADFMVALAASGADGVMPGYGALLTRLVTREDHPAIYRVVDSGAFDNDDDPDVEFDFGLARVLDGIGVLIKQRTA